jgi:hypothetical protein
MLNSLIYNNYIIYILIILLLIKILPAIILLFKPKDFNFSETKLGNYLRELDNDYYINFISLLSFTILTILYSIRIYKSNYNNKTKIILIILILLLNYILILPLINLWNIILMSTCNNPPINIDKQTYFKESELFENKDNFNIIQNEVQTFIKNNSIPCLHEVIPDITISPKTDKEKCWHFLPLKLAGKLKEEYREQFPFLFKLLECDNISNVIISSLDAGMNIPAHRGYFKGYLRYHLGIDVPTDKSPYIVCGGQTYKWKTGEGILFDDMYLHHVDNPSEYKRTVIYMDIKRNNLSGITKYINNIFYYLIDNSIIIKLFIQDQHKQIKKD